ncbi:MAG: fadE5 1, partial [Mycobacterium sp.]|nr:fadE5 1 [Mycobacterium sp.]
ARVNDLLLPIVKGVGSERAYQCLTESLQTFGGSGFLQDYPIEQYIRDAKIDSLYEGTTAIQAQDFIFRKIIRDHGAALGHVLGLIEASADHADHAELRRPVETLVTAVSDVKAMATALTGYLLDAQQDARQLYRVGLESVRFLLATGDVVIGWLLLRHAEIALQSLDDNPSTPDRPFYRGKVEVATFFATSVLPRLAADRQVIENVDLQLMDLPEESF